MVPARWIVSPAFDLALLAAPLLLTLGVVAVPHPEGRLEPWAFFLLVVAFDVAHVWTTLYLGFLDRGALRRRPALFLLPAPLCALAAFRLHQHSPALFWTALAYVAIHHFISQQWGFVALYRARAGERDPFDRTLDKWTLWTGALGPLLAWHASERDFDWFSHGEDFLFRLDPGLAPDLAVVMVVTAAVYVLRQVHLARQGRLNPGKNLWMAASWSSWGAGYLLADVHPLLALGAINLLHGIPFLALVWRRLNLRWEGLRPEGGPRLLAWLSQRRHWVAFYALPLCLALGEEGLWEWLVWGAQLSPLRAALELGPTARSALVAALATPQMVHYFLDGWLWRMDGSNPDLALLLEGRYAKDGSVTPASA